MVNSNFCYSGVYFRQTCNINLGGRQWVRIGYGYGGANVFKGSFDGGNYSISGLLLKESDSTKDAQGLFGTVCGAVIKNVRLVDSVVKVPVNFVGSIVGLAYDSSSIINCFSNAKVYSEGREVGGIVGELYNSIAYDCYFSGHVEANQQVGGIVGLMHTTSSTVATNKFRIVGCNNSGYVKANADYVGGILGATDKIADANPGIKNCISSGVIEAGRVVGSIVGDMNTPMLILNCVASGQIYVNEKTVIEYICGIAGYLCDGGEIQNCSFIGSCNAPLDNAFAICVPSETITINSSFIQVNRKGYYSSGDFSEWGVVNRMNDGLPIQKALYHVAQFGDSVSASWFADKGFEKI